jgi:hypothetical protein
MQCWWGALECRRWAAGGQATLAVCAGTGCGSARYGSATACAGASSAGSEAVRREIKWWQARATEAAMTEEKRKATPGPGEPKAPARPSLAVAAMPIRGRNGGSAGAGARVRMELWLRHTGGVSKTRRGPRTHAVRSCTGATRQGRSKRGSGNRRRRRSYAEQRRAGQRRAERQRAAHGGVSAGRAQAATELVCRKVARGAGSAAVWWLRANSHGSSRATRGERQRPSRRRQRKARP